MAQGESVRANFLKQLEEMLDLLAIAADHNQPEALEPMLDGWVKGFTQTEIETLQNQLSPLLSQIMAVTFRAARQNLDLTDALDLIDALVPIFAHSMQYAALAETRLHVEHITDELNQARLVVERLEKSKSDFISVAAHELKTPLTLIEGYNAMLNDVLPTDPSLNSQAITYTKGINAGTRRLREIVDDMIDVSLIDNDLLSLNYQPVWLNRMLGAVQREVNEVLKERHLSLQIKCFPGSEEMFFADGERLFQALRNVITNAVKYTPDGGTISVDGRLLSGFVEVIVEDSGIGIDPEDHIHIFEKFGRLGNVSLHSSGKLKFKGGGPGLGLPITKGIIEAHGGAIWVESDGYDKSRLPGSTFHIMIPLLKSPPDDKSAKLFRGLSEPFHLQSQKI